MQDDLKQIHAASMKILEEAGIKFRHPDAVDVLIKNGIRVSGDTAFFTKEQVMDWVGKAPSSFKIFARNSEYDMTIGGDSVECAPGYGAPSIVDIEGKRRPALLSDYITFLKLCQQSKHFKVNGGILVQPNDVDNKDSLAMMLYSTLVYSDKCLMTGTGEANEIETLMDMLSIVFGGKQALIEKPRTITIINTNSPLQMDQNMLETMMVYVKHGQPVIIAAATMSGTTGPMTLAGNIALANAEILAGIAFAQMLREGTPVVYGSQTTTADMKTGSMASGSPEGALCYEYASRLAKAYGIPCRGGGAVTDAKNVSVQSGYESMMTYLVCHKARMNYIIHSAGILDSYSSMSFEQFIVDLEIISMVNRYANGIEINNDTLATEVIKEVGIGGHFLDLLHTMQYCRKEPFIPDVSIRGTVEGDPNQKLVENINLKKDSMLNTYQRPELSIEIDNQLVNYLNKKGINVKNYLV